MLFPNEGASIRDVCTLGGGRGLATMRTKMDRGRGLAECEHPFQCSLRKRKEGTQWPFYDHLPELKTEK